MPTEQNELSAGASRLGTPRRFRAPRASGASGPRPTLDVRETSERGKSGRKRLSTEPSRARARANTHTQTHTQTHTHTHTHTHTPHPTRLTSPSPPEPLSPFRGPPAARRCRHRRMSIPPRLARTASRRVCSGAAGSA